MVEVILAVPLAVLCSVVGAMIAGARSYCALWSGAVVLVDTLALVPRVQWLRRRAASTQELFDCCELDLDVSRTKTGVAMSAETVARYADKHRRHDPSLSRLREWYPQGVSSLPSGLARLLCQRANFWWEEELHQEFAGWIAWALVVTAVTVLVIALAGGFDVDKLIMSGLMPLLPAFNVGLRERRDHLNSALAAARLKGTVDGIWEDTLHGRLGDSEIVVECRNLQDELYHHRCSSPLVPDWFYRYRHAELERQSNKATEKLVKEASEHLK
jgi:hypothetical protein